jgi:hypothetical protein
LVEGLYGIMNEYQVSILRLCLFIYLWRCC